MLYDTLAVGEADTAIHVTVYTSTTPGEAVVNLWVRSLGDPTLKDSITTRTFAGAGVDELNQAGLGKNGSTATVAVGWLRGYGRYELFDAAGRRVGNLWPGENSIRHLPAGVYLLWSVAGGSAPRLCVLVK
ncbi:MAG: hypothetical protein ABIK43_00080 [candidate division WOR-3 bacterium]